MLPNLDFNRVKKRTQATRLARGGADKHEYFMAVAQMRYILRKVFRMIEEKAKDVGLDPLAHQALLQIYGSPRQKLRVRELAERLDIAPAFASNLVKALVKGKLVKRASYPNDLRVTVVQLTGTGRNLCHQVDTDIRPHLDEFTTTLSREEQEIALSTLMFYIEPSASVRRRNMA